MLKTKYSNEIIRIFAKLMNVTAAGHDEITAEMVKDYAEILTLKYEKHFNKIFENHEEPANINEELF